VIVVRPVQDTDADAVRVLDASAMARDPDPPRPPRTSADLQRTLDRQLGFWVAVESDANDEIVGMIALRRPDEDLPDSLLESRAHVGELVSMRVSPDRQRQGIGAQLLSTLIDWARAAGLDAVVVNATSSRVAAMGLYTANGFREAARSVRGTRELLWFDLDLKAVPSAPTR
jgi:ribosomal protein S18 acetylase RimI-like enzyme